MRAPVLSLMLAGLTSYTSVRRRYVLLFVPLVGDRRWNVRPLTVARPFVAVIDNWYGPGMRLAGTVKVICVLLQFAADTGTIVLPSRSTPGAAPKPVPCMTYGCAPSNAGSKYGRSMANNVGLLSASLHKLRAPN